MIKFLPASFEGNLTHPRNALVAHSGTVPVPHSIVLDAHIEMSFMLLASS